MGANGPDFLCIGMQKAGTSWIYDCLGRTPGYRMLPVKELHHFDRRPGGPDRQAQVGRWKMLGDHLAINLQMRGRRQGLRQVLAFNRRYRAYLDGGRRDADYLALWTGTAAGLSGDVTPAYSTLSDAAVARVHALLPQARILMSVRDPVARAWSQFNKHLRDTVATPAQQREPRAFQQLASPLALTRFLKSPGVLARSFPSQTYDRWRAHYGAVAVVSFDEIACRPDRAFAAIVAATGGPAGLSCPAVANRKENFAKARMEPAHRAILTEAFAEELAASAARFGSIAAGWGGPDRR